MQEWKVLACNCNIDIRDKCIVASLNFPDIVNSKKLTFNSLLKNKVFLTPPILDYCNEFIVIDVYRKISSSYVCFKIKNFNLYFKNRCKFKNLLVSKENYDSFVQSNNLDFLCDFNIGKVVIDKNIGEIGTIKDFSNNKFQSQYIVDYNNKLVYIPNVPQIVYSVDDKFIYCDLPNGLLDIN